MSEPARAIRKQVKEAETWGEKVAAVERMIWERCRSPEGLVYCFVMAETLDRPRIDDVLSTAPDPDGLTGADYMYNDEKLAVRYTLEGKPQYLLQGIPVKDVEAYEDSILSTSKTLSALCCKYRATLDGTVLDQARTLFDALYSVYELGLQDQPGWMPKPYGFQCTKQSSTDNQCPFHVALLRYYGLAPAPVKERIRRVLVDVMDYWMRHRYKMHRTYFGLWVDYKTERFYPGHWPLLYLPLCYGVWRLTGEEKYRQEYEWLLGRVHIDKGADPEYLRTTIRCSHRWFYQYGALLEFGAEPRELWLRGLQYQVAASRGRSDYAYSWPGYNPDMFHHAWIWLTPRDERDREQVQRTLMAQDVDTFRYVWPENHRPIAPLAWRSGAMYGFRFTNWLEVQWKGRMRGDW